MEQLLLCLAVEARALPAIAGRRFQRASALLVGVHCPLDACHGAFLARRAAVRDRQRMGRVGSAAEELLDAVRVRSRYLFGPGEAPGQTRGLAFEQVALTSVLGQQPAGARHLDALFHPAMSLVLWHQSSLSSV